MRGIPIVTGGSTPDAPTIGTASAANGQATVVFTVPAYTGKSTTGVVYRAISTPGNIEATNTISPIVVTGLSNGTTYTFKVETETNYGVDSPQSSASNAVTPTAPAPPPPPPPSCASAGTFLNYYCNGFTLVQNYADGSCGSYQVVTPNDTSTCGYVPPACNCLTGSAGVKICSVSVGGCRCRGTQLYALTYSDPAGCQPCGTEVTLSECQITDCTPGDAWSTCPMV